MLENTMFLLLLFAIGLIEMVPDKEIRYSMIEVNHRVNRSGDHMFTQAILWDWHKLDKKFHVQAWTMLRCNSLKEELWVIERYHRQDEWRLTFHDNHGRMVVCKARLYRESFTKDDPEVKDRSFYSQDRRRGFRGEEEILQEQE